MNEDLPPPGQDSWGNMDGRIYWLECHSCRIRGPDGGIGRLCDCDNTHIHSREADPKCTPQGPQE